MGGEERQGIGNHQFVAGIVTNHPYFVVLFVTVGMGGEERRGIGKHRNAIIKERGNVKRNVHSAEGAEQRRRDAP